MLCAVGNGISGKGRFQLLRGIIGMGETSNSTLAVFASVICLCNSTVALTT